MKKKIVTFGEIMMRLSPKSNKRFSQAEDFKINFGGAEANVAVLLANLGIHSTFVSKLPENPIGDMVERYLDSNRVDTSYIAYGGERLGVYYFENGNSVRSSKVVYDRKSSAMSTSKKGDFSFEEVFKDADWFHFSGITAALGENCVEALKEAIKVAKKNDVKISVDLNYRSKLWDYGTFKTVMRELIKDVDLCIGWIDLNSKSNEFTPVSFKDEVEEKDYFIKVFGEMNKELNVGLVATTIRETFSTSRNSLRGVIFDGDKLIASNKYEFDITDRVGAGDAFAAGLLCELANDKDIKEALEFAVASGVYKHTIEGDASIASYEEIKGITTGILAGGVAR
ncbi:sugar kinase [Clostridium cavendishii]|nr:sugar kinase [Clostridium cavendishii]